MRSGERIQFECLLEKPECFAVLTKLCQMSGLFVQQPGTQLPFRLGD